MGYSSTIHSKSMVDMGTFTEYLLLVSINIYDLQIICIFALNAKKLHHEQGRYKQIESSFGREETYSKVVSRASKS